MNLLSTVRRRLSKPRGLVEGYENEELVEVVFQKTRSYKPKEPWPDMIGVKSVLDFGGGCGIHYKRAVIESPNVKWAVVETPAMVSRAVELATDNMRFFSSITEARAWLGQIDIMHSNGALQYTPDPKATLESLCDLRASQMIWSAHVPVR